MKKYTQEEFDGFETDEFGYKVCPSGDYTNIKNFGEWCSFGKGCSFGEQCSFGESCRFGESCSFGEVCSFSKWCRFGEGCRFGGWCGFGEGCSFSERCSFGEGCRFDEGCRFGGWCGFGEGCSHEGLTNSTYVAVDRIGSEERKTYFFKADEGYFVRAGCWFGTFDEFEKRVKEVHAGTVHEKTYLMALELAKVMLDSEVE